MYYVLCIMYYVLYIIYHILYIIYYIISAGPLGPPGCEAQCEKLRIQEASKLYLRIKGVFKELRGFRILAYSNLRILQSENCRTVTITIQWGCTLLVWEPPVAHLGAPNRSIPLYLAPNISQDSPTCSQDRPRQPNLQPRSPKTAQLGFNMAILARFSSIWLPFRTPYLPKTFKNKLFFNVF